MVLQSCPNESGECAREGCDKKEDHVWYRLNGQKGDNVKCKGCYLKDKNLKDKASPGGGRSAAALEDFEDGSAGDECVTVLAVYGSRPAAFPILFARACSNPLSAFVCSLTAAKLPSVPCVSCAARRRRFGAIPRGRGASRERRNPLEDDEMKLEYDVYGWFKFETDSDGVRALDRQWVARDELVGFAGGFEEARAAWLALEAAQAM